MAVITQEEFMNEYVPEYPAWAEAGEIEVPSEARIRGGWVVEQPKHTFFNWHMNRSDKRIAALEAEVAWLKKCLAGQIVSCDC